MHGLNTRQRVDFLTSLVQNQFEGSSQLAYTQYASVDAPGYLSSTGMINGLVVSPEAQVYVKRLYGILYVTNSHNFPCVCETYLLRCRYDFPAGKTMTTVLNQDSPGSLKPRIFSAVYWGTIFKKQVKIIKSKHFIMRPGKTYKFKVPGCYNNSTRPIQGDTEGDAVGFNYRKGNYVRMNRYYGVPLLNATDPGEDAPGASLSSLALASILKGYVSYYTMDDSVPDSVAQNNIPTTLATSNAYPNATMYGAVRPSVNSSTGAVPPDYRVVTY
ncbi:capsid protein [Capybara virus 24_cap1_1774]|nr:capsid protein [Capybara virus 24_cap1_1774]